MTPDWLDERIRLGETPAASRSKANSRLSSKEGIAIQRELALSDASILERLPPERFAEKLRHRQTKAHRGIFAWTHSRLSLLAIASIALAVVVAPRLAEKAFAPAVAPMASNGKGPSIETTTPRSVAPREEHDAQVVQETPEVVAAVTVSDNGIRTRGEQNLSLFTVAPDGSAAPAGSAVQAGTVLRIVAPASPHAAVWSIDETGLIQRHWPIKGDSAALLPAGPLPRDWETDPTAGWERFVIVTSPTPFSLATAEAHLRGLVASKHARDKAISLPGQLLTSSVTVERAAR